MTAEATSPWAGQEATFPGVLRGQALPTTSSQPSSLVPALSDLCLPMKVVGLCVLQLQKWSSRDRAGETGADLLGLRAALCVPWEGHRIRAVEVRDASLESQAGDGLRLAAHWGRRPQPVLGSELTLVLCLHVISSLCHLPMSNFAGKVADDSPCGFLGARARILARGQRRKGFLHLSSPCPVPANTDLTLPLGPRLR